MSTDANIFTKSAKGVMELNSRSSRLPRDVLRVLKLIDGRSTVTQLAERSGQSVANLLTALEKLEHDGYVRALTEDQLSGPSAPAPATPAAEVEDLDFTVSLKGDDAPKRPRDADANRKALEDAERRAREEVERRRAQEMGQRKAREEQEQRARKDAERRTKAETERKAKEEASQRAKEDAAANAREQAEQKARAEAERKAKEQAEQKARAEAERKAKEQAEQKARAEAERKAKEQAEQLAKAEAERKAKETSEQRTKALRDARSKADEALKAAQALRGRIDEARRERKKAVQQADEHRAAAVEKQSQSTRLYGRPAATAALLEKAEASLEAQAASLGTALERAEAEARLLQEALSHAQSYVDVVAQAAGLAADDKSLARTLADARGAGERSVNEFAEMQVEVEAALTQLKTQRDTASRETRRVAEARGQAQAEARTRANTVAAAHSRADEARRSTDTGTKTASDAERQRAEAAAALEDARTNLAKARQDAEAAADPRERVAKLKVAESAAGELLNRAQIARERAQQAVKAASAAAAFAKAEGDALQQILDNSEDDAERTSVSERLEKSRLQRQRLTKTFDDANRHADGLADARSAAEKEQRAIQESISASEKLAEAMARVESAVSQLDAQRAAVSNCSEEMVSAIQDADSARGAWRAAESVLKDDLGAEDRISALAKSESLGYAGVSALQVAAGRSEAGEAAIASALESAQSLVQALEQCLALARFTSDRNTLEARLHASRERQDELSSALAEAKQRTKDLAQARADADKKVQGIRSARAKAEADLEAERKAREVEQARLREEAERKAREEEEARLREEAERKAREAEEARARAEEARRAREAEEARLRTESERKAREEEEARAREEADLKARQDEEARTREEAERRARDEEHARAREEAALKARQEEEARLREEAEGAAAKAAKSQTKEESDRLAAEEMELAARDALTRISEEASRGDLTEEAGAAALAAVGAEEEEEGNTTFGRSNRTFIASVLFLDIVEYSTRPVQKQIETKKQFNELVSGLIRGVPERDRVILDTGDGAAVSFLGDPEDALAVASQLQELLRANGHRSYPELYVRMGINLGPVKIVQDMRGHINILGDAINDAQRVMGFANPDHLMVSRSFYDVVARLSSEHARMFRYQGSRRDKHGREHQLYEYFGSEGMRGAPQEEVQPAKGTDFTGLDLSGLQAVGGAAAPQAAGRPGEPAVEQQSVGAAEARELAQEEAEAKAEAEAEAKATSEEEERRAREEEEARARQEALLREQAEADRKVWEQARSRRPVAEPGEEEAEPVQAPAPARRRKTLPLGKIAAGLLVAVVGGGIALVHVMPMDSAARSFEQAAAARFGEPVVVGSASAALFPSPRLTLRDVTLGKANELKISSIVVPGLSAVFGSASDASTLELHGITGSDAALASLPRWGAASGQGLSATLLELTDVRLKSGATELPPFGGSIVLGPSGARQASLQSLDKKLSLQMSRKDSALELNFKAGAWQIPGAPALSLDSAQFKATLTSGGPADVEMFDATLFGGVASGKGRVSWRDGIVFEGDLELRAIDLRLLLAAFTANPPVSGTFRGTGRFTLRAASHAELFKSPALGLDFTVERGALETVDLAQLIQSPGRGAAVGQTKFDDLTGTMTLAGGRYQFNSLKLNRGVLNAAGAVNIAPDGDMNGRVSVSFQSPVNPLRGNFQVSGSAAKPELR